MLSGTLNDVPVRVLKDDGCNTNVVSNRFVERNRHCLTLVKRRCMVKHSQKGSDEVSTEAVLDGTLKIGGHTYKSNWVVSNCRYDVLLGMPWHVSYNPKVDYCGRQVRVKDTLISGKHVEFDSETPAVKMTNLGVKKFRQMLRRKSPSHFQVFQVIANDTTHDLKIDKLKNSRLRSLLERYKSVFRSELPDGLPPKRGMDHEIEVEKGSKPPHRPLYQLPPAEQKAAKEYIEKLLSSGKIRRSRSPYGAPLFFVKDTNGLRGLVEYRALNMITKRRNATMPSCDEMFDRIGGATVFSKIDLKTGFHVSIR